MKPEPDTVALYETASAWFTRRQARDDWSDRTEAELRTWLQADPRHYQAYQEIAETWAAFDHIARPALASDARRSIAADHRRPAPPPLAKPAGKAAGAARGWTGVSGGRRGFAMAALAACVLLGTGGWYWHDNTPQFTESIQTAHGEPREVALPDGTVLSVNKDSRLEVLFYPRRREVLLVQGEAFFNVAHRNADTFVVKTGNTQVRVVGTAFNVRVGPTLYVKVREGIVEVTSRGDGRDYKETLRAGEALGVDIVTGVQQHIPSAPDVAGSWRTGQLVFRNATLAEVADELQGYLGRPIELVGREVRQRRLSGFAHTKDPQGFLDALPLLLPVDVRRSPNGDYRIAER